MSEGLQGVNQGSEPVVTTADENVSTVSPVEPVVSEKVFMQSDVSKIAGKEHRRGYDEGYKKAQIELAKSQTAAPAADANGGLLTPQQAEEIASRKANEAIQAAIADNERKRREQEEQDYLARHAHHYHQNVTAGKEKYPDFEQQLERVKWLDSAGALALTPLINEFDNAADIMYELSKKDEKLASLIGTFQHGKAAPALIKEKLHALSNSIKQNETALTNAKSQPRPPLSTINSSNRGTDSGRATVSELRAKYKA
jgi:hypothetical protein